ncbi:MAG: hypothetical protein ACLFVP_02870 [Candidatus Bathyarchaeia archaeon]
MIVPRDCVEAASEEANQRSLEYMEEMYGVNVRTSDEIMGEVI